MLSASYFTYDGVYSGQYGLQIATLNDKSFTKTEKIFTPKFTQVKAANGRRFYHAGIQYDQAPEFEFSLISETPIYDIAKREILSWLHCRNQYKKLEIHQSDFEDYYYMCIFTNISIIYINSECYGFTATAKFDSPFGYGIPTRRTIVGNGTEQTFRFANNSDILDDFVAPSIEFTPTQKFTDNGVDKYFSIKTNNLGDYSLPCEFIVRKDEETQQDIDDIVLGSKVVIDGENQFIESDNAQTYAIRCFNKQWLKLRHGANTIKFTINGSMTIICPNYCLIGF